MGCSTDKNRASVGLFVSTLMQVLQKWATKAAKCAREQKLQAVLALLAVFTFLSLLVRGGVERKPGPIIQRIVDRAWRTEHVIDRVWRTEHVIYSVVREQTKAWEREKNACGRSDVFDG